MQKYDEKIGFFGAVSVALIMVSGTTIGIMTQLNESSKIVSIVSSDATIVEPGIYLSGYEQRKILSDSLSYVDDSDVYLLVQAIIAEMDLKGFVNSTDIEHIVNDNNLVFELINYNTINTGDDPNPGYAIRLGNPFQNSGELSFGVLFWVAKQSYDPAREINLTLHEIFLHVNDHRGWAFGFTGTFSNGEEEAGHWFTIHGAALLIVIKPPLFGGSSSQSQSNTQCTPMCSTIQQTIVASTNIQEETTSQ